MAVIEEMTEEKMTTEEKETPLLLDSAEVLWLKEEGVEVQKEVLALEEADHLEEGELVLHPT